MHILILRSEKFFFVLSFPLVSLGFGPPKSETDVTCVHACACTRVRAYDGGCGLASSTPTYIRYVCMYLCGIGSSVRVCIGYTRVRARVCALNEGHLRQTVQTFEKVNRQSTRQFATHSFSPAIAPTRFPP